MAMADLIVGRWEQELSSWNADCLLAVPPCLNGVTCGNCHDPHSGELLAEDLRQCQNSLGEITGAVSSDDLLGEIFSSFCIGK